MSSSGLTTRSRLGRMPDRPLAPAPRSRRSRNVSAWSSRVCPVAIVSAFSVAAISARHSYRAWRAATSMDTRPSAASRATSRRRASKATPSLAASARQNASSLSLAAPRSPWLTCARPATVNPQPPATSSSSSRSATESDPPDTAATTLDPGGMSASRSMASLTRSWSDAIRRTCASAPAPESPWPAREGEDAAPAEAAGKGARGLAYQRSTPRRRWCRCRDLNPGLRGYEPRALTN